MLSISPLLLIGANIIYVCNMLSETDRMTHLNLEVIELILLFLYLVFFIKEYISKIFEKKRFLIALLVIFVNLASVKYEFSSFWIVVHFVCYIYLVVAHASLLFPFMNTKANQVQREM